MRTTLVYVGIVVGAVLLASAVSYTPAPARGSVALAAHAPEPCPNPAPVPDALRLPPTVPPGEPTAIEKNMLRYLYGDDPGHVPSSSPNLYPYRRLGWCVDKYVRDTGPYVHGQYYGTHAAVRIYYSPEMMTWLRNGRHGVPADGAVIITEQFNPTRAARYEGLHDAHLQPHDWTVMIRRTGASHDGWFWAEVYTKTAENRPMTFGGTQYPNAGFGLYCLRCHGSANDAGTFAALDNIKGFAGEPLTFKIDDTWRAPPPTPDSAGTATPQIDREHEKNAQLPTHVRAVPPGLQTFPVEPLDTMLAHPKGPPQFMTSDQCMGCHGAASGAPSGPLMWLTPPPAYTPPPSPPPGSIGVHVSEYGEWRWSPMGLAGRDPVFFSQLESEQHYVDTIPDREIAGNHPAQTRATLKQQVVDTCMRCHGVMGKRQNEIDHGPNAHFDEKWVFAADPAKPSFHYGGLARDGISCTVCHHITQPEHESLADVLTRKNTGLFDVGPPDKIHGPFETKTIAAHPMKSSLGTTPVFGALTKSARLCASCHSINLPVVDAPDKIHPIVPAMAHDVEQNTYVEWVNSKFQTEYKPGKGAKSCQDCHMAPSVANERLGVNDPEIPTRIALVQDETYPAAEHRAPLDGIEVRYRRHGFRLDARSRGRDRERRAAGAPCDRDRRRVRDACRRHGGRERRRAEPDGAPASQRRRLPARVDRAEAHRCGRQGRVVVRHDEPQRRDRRRTRHGAADGVFHARRGRQAAISAALRRAASDHAHRPGADLRRAHARQERHDNRQLHPPRPPPQGQPAAARGLAQGRSAGDRAARELARRDAAERRVRHERSALRGRQRTRRGDVPYRAAARNRRVAAAHRGDAVVAVVGAVVQARAHARHGPRRHAAALSAEQSRARRHGARGLEAADRVGDDEPAVEKEEARGRIPGPRSLCVARC